MANVSKYIGKKGELTYRFRVYCGCDTRGKQLFKTKTWKPDKSLSARQAECEAKLQAAQFEKQVIEEQQTADCRQPVSFQELADEWLELMERTQELKISTIVMLKGCRSRTYAALGDTMVTDINYRQIQKFILSLSEDGVNKQNGKGLSVKSQQHYINFISDVMRYAMKCGIVTANPCVGISVVKTEKKERCPYTLEEEVALLDRLSAKAPLQYQVFFRFMIYCGLRRGEVLGLEWKDIDFETGICSIQRTSQYRGLGVGIYTSTPKTKSSHRCLKLPNELLTILKRFKFEQNGDIVRASDAWHPTDRLFTQWNGLPMHPARPYNWLLRFCEREKLPFKGLHSFRHAFATEMITSGQIDVKTVSSILGHSEVSTTLNIYTHEVQKVTAQALDFVSELIDSQRKQA